MAIDWLTVAAQFVNFLVLVWLLQRFLFGPIGRAMARREQRIEDRLDEAAQTRREAEERLAALEEKHADLDRQREALMSEARDAARAFRDDLETMARREIDEARSAWRQQVSDEKSLFLGDLRKRAAGHLYELARSSLAELADSDVQDKLAGRFCDKLRELDPERLARIRRALDDKGGPVVIETGRELAPAVKAQITRTLHELIGRDVEVTYRGSEGLPLGIRLNAASQSVEWSLARYLERLERDVEARLETATARGEREAA